jgi:hypothetical protein
LLALANELNRIAGVDVAYWHFSAVPAAPINVRSWGENGLNADMPQRPNLTQVV